MNSFADRKFMECAPVSGSLWLDAREPDHLGPLLGFFGNQLLKVGGRSRKGHAADVGKACFDLGVGKPLIDLFVELANDIGWGASRCTDAIPRARLVAWHIVAQGRYVWKRARARGRCY